MDKIKESIELVDPAVHQAILSNILITGGHSRTNNFGNRLRKELARTPLSPLCEFKPHHVKEHSGDVASFGSWKGAAMFASSPTFEQTLITQELFEEVGPSIIHSFRQ